MEKAKGQGIPVRSSFGHHETGRSEVARQNNLLIFIWLSEPIWYLYFRQINRDLKTEILRQQSVLSLRGRPARSRIFSCLLSMPSAVFASSVFGHKCSYSEGKTSRRAGALQAQTDAPLKQADERRPSSTSEFSFAKGRPTSPSNYVLRSRGVCEVPLMAACTEEGGRGSGSPLRLLHAVPGGRGLGSAATRLSLAGRALHQDTLHLSVRAGGRGVTP